MLSPRALNLLLKHLDDVDLHFSGRLNRRRPWAETALTSLLADLLDEEIQPEYGLTYDVRKLNEDLALGDGIFRVSFQLETHEYSPKVERWLTQSDLGMVIRYDDNLVPQDSWKSAWLFQAKRVSPSLRQEPRYSERSRFGGFDPQQHERIKRLVAAVGTDFVQYLLYCPRPCHLETGLRRKLAYLRTRALAGHIFDYSLGLALRDDLLKADSTLAAAMFISPPDSVPKSLGEVHATVFKPTMPFSWFIAHHFAYGGTRISVPRSLGLSSRMHPEMSIRRPGNLNPHAEGLAEGIVTGDENAVDQVIEMLGEDGDEFPFLPAHTLTVRVTTGEHSEGQRLGIDLPD